MNQKVDDFESSLRADYFYSRFVVCVCLVGFAFPREWPNHKSKNWWLLSDTWTIFDSSVTVEQFIADDRFSSAPSLLSTLYYFKNYWKRYVAFFKRSLSSNLEKLLRWHHNRNSLNLLWAWLGCLWFNEIPNRTRHLLS